MLLTQKALKQEKEQRYNNQKGKCLLCNLPLDDDVQKNHLDHDHALDGSNKGRVRGLLCSSCNVAEGMIKNKFNRSGLKYKVDYIFWLQNMVKYLSEDYSGNNYHPQYLVDKTKEFKRLSKTEMIEVMKANDYSYDLKDDKKALTKKFKQQHKRSINGSH